MLVNASFIFSSCRLRDVACRAFDTHGAVARQGLGCGHHRADVSLRIQSAVTPIRPIRDRRIRRQPKPHAATPCAHAGQLRAGLDYKGPMGRVPNPFLQRRVAVTSHDEVYARDLRRQGLVPLERRPVRLLQPQMGEGDDDCRSLAPQGGGLTDHNTNN